MDLKYLDVDKKGEYKIKPEIIKLENRDLLNYFNIDDIKKAHNNKKQLQITDKGIYSISKPYLSQWICNIILNNIDNSKSYDVISCQFAFHYFTQNTNTINNVLYLVSSKLKKGGYFIGTATDGDLIHNILKKGNVNISMLDIIHNKDNNYVFNIDALKNNSNKTQNYFQLKGASSEFFIFKNLLKDIALKHNLVLIEYKSFHEYYTEFKQKKILYSNLTPYEMIISFLNFSFVFQKQ